MKTIEERAYKYAEAATWDDVDGCPSDICATNAYNAYVEGATEQKAIDDALWLRKVYKWIKENVECGVHPQSAYGFADRFLKAMKE